MELNARTLSLVTATALAVVVSAYAVGHWRGSGKERRLNLARYRWKKRVVLVFAPDAENEAYQIQMGQIASEADEARDRDLVVIPVLATGKEGVSRRDAAMLARAYEVNRREFRMILIGKDGTVKRSERRPMDVERLFEIIDAMPMRRSEAANRR